MRVAIAGAHGKIGMRLTRVLSGDGHTVVGLIRNAEQGEEVRAQGGEPLICDLEEATVEEIEAAITGADAAVLAAGAGPGSGAKRKLTMDRDGAIKLLHAADAMGVPRYLIVSAVGAEDPPEGNDVFSVYLHAKAEADAAVQASGREWTILRPGRLIDDPGTGRVRLQTAPFRGEVPRDDVAAVIAALLGDPRAIRRILYLNGGEDPLPRALDAALA